MCGSHCRAVNSFGRHPIVYRGSTQPRVLVVYWWFPRGRLVVVVILVVVVVLVVQVVFLVVIVVVLLSHIDICKLKRAFCEGIFI